MRPWGEPGPTERGRTGPAFLLTLANYSQTLITRGGRRRNSASPSAQLVGRDRRTERTRLLHHKQPPSSPLIPPAGSWKPWCSQMVLQESRLLCSGRAEQPVTPSCPHRAAAIAPIAAWTDLFKLVVIYFLNAHWNSYQMA